VSLTALREALAALHATRSFADAPIVPMPAKGVAHAHFRLVGHSLVLRVPRLSQWGMPAAENLAYQAACFRRAEPSGATPRLVAMLPPREHLPRGALLVEEITGRPPRLPDDLPAIAGALARLHTIAVPSDPGPLRDQRHEGPFAATLAVIVEQSSALHRSEIPPLTRQALETEIAWASDFAANLLPAVQPVTLVGTDTHPGNFIIRRDGRAMLVDLEKAAYGSPAIDVAHATLYTSTTWDAEVDAELSAAEVAHFYDGYLAKIDAGLAERLRPLLAPSRRLTWLRTMMWCVRWLAAAAESGEWSAAHVDPALLRHMRRRVAVFLDPATVARVRREWLE
jgi:hypothetical protein